ncbi:MAG: hypothetical protein K0Q51_526 [Rickettsiaceae bacterium]|jgi:hypothetical protein|nr:hypothetical protein [Rickettsiaceae bacterium]
MREVIIKCSNAHIISKDTKTKDFERVVGFNLPSANIASDIKTSTLDNIPLYNIDENELVAMTNNTYLSSSQNDPNCAPQTAPIVATNSSASVGDDFPGLEHFLPSSCDNSLKELNYAISKLSREKAQCDLMVYEQKMAYGDTYHFAGAVATNDQSE